MQLSSRRWRSRERTGHEELGAGGKKTIPGHVAQWTPIRLACSVPRAVISRRADAPLTRRDEFREKFTAHRGTIASVWSGVGSWATLTTILPAPESLLGGREGGEVGRPHPTLMTNTERYHQASESRARHSSRCNSLGCRILILSLPRRTRGTQRMGANQFRLSLGERSPGPNVI
ncbi:uncharacterized protein LOC112552741 [Pogonomyrmex barbatus]|uniref:Uncharacterized protein LOC112552741 n=1 Tax=Pogonomyrmex barbatus TaxID=144034 RepID=A0A8N1S8G1_9HYME|nr:uncharacterized protein LOC112552741 [Pogonomyrmex barbatus]